MLRSSDDTIYNIEKEQTIMKKQIKVVGLQHKKGISTRMKEPYDFYVMHAVYSDPDTEGICCLSVTIPEQEASAIVIGEEFTFYSHFYNGKECYDAILR